jgi:hypothetical protein
MSPKMVALVLLLAVPASAMAQQTGDDATSRAAMIGALGQQLYRQGMQLETLQNRMAIMQSKCGKACSDEIEKPPVAVPVVPKEPSHAVHHTP